MAVARMSTSIAVLAPSHDNARSGKAVRRTVMQVGREIAKSGAAGLCRK
jgi:hypothetical protein